MGCVQKWYASLSDPPLERNECTLITISPFSLPIDMIVVTGNASLDTDIEATQFVLSGPQYPTSEL